MSSSTFRKFQVAYTDKATGEQRKEVPRLVVTVDGKHKSLVVEDNTILASLDYDAPDSDLWKAARKAVESRV